jgi:SAM-dependent methyltransferase
MSALEYVGNELELFKEARRWKKYWATMVAPFVTRNVLEVGAGLGGTTRVLCDGRQSRWTALEPDASLADELARSFDARPALIPIEVVRGTISSLTSRSFDCILYIDVLEHIEDDRAELARAVRLLAPGGTVVILSPAHDWLFSSFDVRIGHHRRYTMSSLKRIVPKGVRQEMLRYLDAAGVGASLANRVMLRQETPSRSQIAFWDSWLVPISRAVDPLLAYRVGKSVLGVWRAPGPGLTR